MKIIDRKSITSINHKPLAQIFWSTYKQDAIQINGKRRGEVRKNQFDFLTCLQTLEWQREGEKGLIIYLFSGFLVPSSPLSRLISSVLNLSKDPGPTRSRRPAFKTRFSCVTLIFTVRIHHHHHHHPLASIASSLNSFLIELASLCSEEAWDASWKTSSLK